MSYPSLKSLQVFEAVARHQNFTKAAGELCITQAAVSHHIRYLEDFFQQRLIYRSARSLELSEGGKNLALSIQKGLFHIFSGVDVIVKKDSQAIDLSASSSFLSFWLVDILPHIWENLPDIQLSFINRLESQPLENEQTDISIIWGRLSDYGQKYPLLFPDIRLLCTHHQYVDLSIGDTVEQCINALLSSHIFFYEEQEELWARWCETYAKGRSFKDIRFISCDSEQMRIKAATSAMGACFIKAPFLAQHNIRESIYCFNDLPIHTDYGYFLAVHPHVSDRPSIKKLCQFIKDKAAETMEKLAHDKII